MSMDREVRRIWEFRTDSGELLLRLRVMVKNEPSTELKKESRPTAEEKGGNGKGNGGNHQSGNHPPMTDAQKRYLFRLLAGEGIEGEAAYEELKKAFGV